MSMGAFKWFQVVAFGGPTPTTVATGVRLLATDGKLLRVGQVLA